MSHGVDIPVPDRFTSDAYTTILTEELSEQRAIVAEGVVAAIEDAGQGGYPHEVCGLLIGSTTPEGDWHIRQARQVDNLNQQRAADRFQLDPARYQRIDRELRGSGSEILGVFHSHPDCPAQPSPTDLASAWDGFLYPIVSICQGKVAEMRWWSLADDGAHFQQVGVRICA